MRPRNKRFTVVGQYPDSSQIFVQWVRAWDPIDAAQRGREWAGKQGLDVNVTDVEIVAIFKGHKSDLYDYNNANAAGRA